MSRSSRRQETTNADVNETITYLITNKSNVIININKYINKYKNIDDNDVYRQIEVNIVFILLELKTLFTYISYNSNIHDNVFFNNIQVIMDRMPNEYKINFTQMQTNIIAILNKTIIKIDNKNRNIFEENLNVYLNINKYILSVKKAYNSNKISIIDIINEHQYQFLINYINSIHYILNSIYTYYEQINNIYESLPDKTVFSRLTSYVSNNGRDIYNIAKSLRNGGDNEYINYKYKNKIYYRKIHYNKGKKYIIINNTNIKIKT